MAEYSLTNVGFLCFGQLKKNDDKITLYRSKKNDSNFVAVVFDIFSLYSNSTKHFLLVEFFYYQPFQPKREFYWNKKKNQHTLEKNIHAYTTRKIQLELNRKNICYTDHNNKTSSLSNWFLIIPYGRIIFLCSLSRLYKSTL